MRGNMDSPISFVDFCAGIGGISLGLEASGMKCMGQVEKNEQCNRILSKWWPDVPRHGDLLAYGADSPGADADLFAFGDNCQKHSRARSNGDSKHPDLAGYCLALVGRLRPWGVLRENVPAPTVSHFAACLEHLGYGTVIIRMDAAPYTGQSRQRDFIVGIREMPSTSIQEFFHDFSDGPGRYTTRFGTEQVIPALTTHRTRYDSRDCYVWEAERGLRILDGDEREAFAGFPAGWTAGFSEAVRARACGNSVVPACAMRLGIAIRRIKSNKSAPDTRHNRG